MRHVVRKPYLDFEKEEKWLNEMSEKGLAMVDYTWCRYVFEEAPKGEYIYKIELLDEYPGLQGSNSRDYLKFLEETGIECVATYMRWAYFRKKAANGPFDLFTDIESKLRHYRKIQKMLLLIVLPGAVIGLSNLFLGLSLTRDGININLYLGVLLISIALLSLFIQILPVYKKIKTLEKEREIRES